MGDVSFDLSKESRFRKMTYGLAVAGVIGTGIGAAALGIAATPLTAAAVLVAGGLTAAVALPTVAVAAFGAAYTAGKMLVTLGKSLTPAGFKRQRFRAKNRKQSVITRIIGKTLKEAKESGGLSLLLTLAVATSASKALVYTPFVGLKEALTTLKNSKKTTDAPKADTPKTVTPAPTQKTPGKTAKAFAALREKANALFHKAKPANDDSKPAPAIKQTKTKGAKKPKSG